ncbi:MAG: AAA family ATPase, partial [Syntrophobacteraceae bacterium]
MESDLNGKLRKSVCQIYDYIRENLYLNRSDMEIKEQHFNAALLLSVFTGILGSKELIIGEPGLGKTTSAEYVCTLLYGMPLGTIWASEVSGHPEQTEEKIIGRPDLGKLNQGEEVVVWSHFALVPTKIVDEINRLPETKQSMILDGVDRGNWSYLNEAISNREYCLFATCNYEDRGTHTIITPLMDRFDVMVESKHPGANLAFLIGTRGVNGARLRHEQLEQEFHELLNARMSVPLILERMEDLAKSYRKALAEEYGIPVLSRHERGLIYKQIREIPIDLDANAFLRLVLSELSFCYRFGQKRSQEDCEDGCHFTGYLCHEV